VLGGFRQYPIVLLKYQSIKRRTKVGKHHSLARIGQQKLQQVRLDLLDAGLDV